MRISLGVLGLTMVVLGSLALSAEESHAIPAFARQTGMSCTGCHRAYPDLNEFGESFAGAGYKIPGSPVVLDALETGDGLLDLFQSFPLALRFQGDLRYRPHLLTDEDEQFLDDAGRAHGLPRAVDIQMPFSVKILSGGAISKYLSYYVYFFLSERGGVGPLEDAWLMAHDFWLPGLAIQAGQYQITDLMFPREIRLFRQDYLIYTSPLSQSGFRLTYHRGINLLYESGPADLVAGIANGSGIGAAGESPAAYPGRHDPMFDGDDFKVGYARLGLSYGIASLGLFGLYGSEGQRTLRNDMWRAGPDLQLDYGGWRMKLQALMGEDNNPNLLLVGDPARADGEIRGGFVDLTWLASERWLFGGLYNRVISTRREVEANLITAMATYYWRRNFKLGLELTRDLQTLRASHPYKEDSVVFFVDTAF